MHWQIWLRSQNLERLEKIEYKKKNISLLFLHICNGGLVIHAPSLVNACEE